MNQEGSFDTCPGRIEKDAQREGLRSPDDFNALVKDSGKEVSKPLLKGELTDHRGYEKHDQKAKATDNAAIFIDNSSILKGT
jgi:hypothetical protein